MDLKLGKLPARPGAMKLKLAHFVDMALLPQPPDPNNYGHASSQTVRGVLGNADYGCCFWSGSAHEHMNWAAAAGRQANFTVNDVLGDYGAATGFTANDPSTDQGTDMQQGASYRRKVGILDSNGVRHQVGAYLAIEPGNIQEHIVASYIFGAVGIGIRFPNSAMDQFDNGQPWDVVKGSRVEGGHYVPLLGRKNGQFMISTWGALHPMTDAFLSEYNDESVVYISPDFLNDVAKTPEGFDMPRLQTVMAALPTA
jgi:hypothetical protein